MVEIENVICPTHNSPLNIKGEAMDIDIDQRITKQQYTTLFPINGTLVVERKVVWIYSIGCVARGAQTKTQMVVDRIKDLRCVSVDGPATSNTTAKVVGSGGGKRAAR